MKTPECRHCQTPLFHMFLDLGHAPPSNAYLRHEDLIAPEISYPLRVYVCQNCWLVQTQDFPSASRLFDEEYAYFSSTSKGWVRHAQAFASKIIDRLSLSKDHFVMEIAANDGYLLRNFKEAEIPCLGIEPTKGPADACRILGIEVVEDFFTACLAKKLRKGGMQADLIVANNVLAHVPDLNDFIKGLKVTLTQNGVISIEFPHFLELVSQNQFDTIYHEHFSYFSLLALSNILLSFGLRVFDVEKLTTHGGSLRVYVCHNDSNHDETKTVSDVLSQEISAGVNTLDFYKGFQQKANNIRDQFLNFLVEAKINRKSVIGYGAAAKGNTLMNFAGVKPNLISYICDGAPAKQNKFMPGSHIPIFEKSNLLDAQPDYVIIFPWNIKDELIAEIKERAPLIKKFVTFIPQMQIHE